MHTPTRTHARIHRLICNTYCFSTATMVLPMHLSVPSYVHCLHCFSFFLLCLRSRDSVVYSGYVTGWSIRSSNRYRTHVVSLPWTGETSSEALPAWPECAVDSSRQSGAEVKNEWSYTSTPPVRRHGVEREGLNFAVNGMHRELVVVMLDVIIGTDYLKGVITWTECAK